MFYSILGGQSALKRLTSIWILFSQLHMKCTTVFTGWPKWGILFVSANPPPKKKNKQK